MSEIIDRRLIRGIEATTWKTQDAEGRDVFATTADRDGVAVEPTTGWLESPETARKIFAEDVALASE